MRTIIEVFWLLTKYFGPLLSGREAVTCWYDEIKDYNYRSQTITMNTGKINDLFASLLSIIFLPELKISTRITKRTRGLKFGHIVFICIPFLIKKNPYADFVHLLRLRVRTPSHLLENHNLSFSCFLRNNGTEPRRESTGSLDSNSFSGEVRTALYEIR